MYCEEFQRFHDGHIYMIHFDDSGNIEKAMIIDGHIEYDITSGVKDDAYWRQRVSERVRDIAFTEDERKRFKQFRDVVND